MLIILLILITLFFDKEWRLLGENLWWSLLGLEGLTKKQLHLWSLPTVLFQHLLGILLQRHLQVSLKKEIMITIKFIVFI